MKRNIVIISVVLTSLSLMAFSFINWNNCKNIEVEVVVKKIYSDFNYNMGPRFEPITQNELKEKLSVSDFDPGIKNMEITTYKSVKIIVIKDGRQTNIQEYGLAEQFTEAQLKLLQSAELSTHFTVRADFKVINEETRILKDSFVGPYYTVVPENQAVYEFGKEKFLEYLEINNKENTANLDESKSHPAAIRFTITKKGTVSNISLDRTSGYSNMDKTIIDLLAKMPGKWIPAKNLKGEKVEQEFVVSFGIKGLGC